MIHYTYLITNTLNGKIYIGVHSTNDINDGYMGSSIPLNNDMQKFGKEYFTKQILNYFPTRDEAIDEEGRLVDDNFVKRQDTYNINLGGQTNTTGLVPVKDKQGNTMMVRKDDPKYINGELVHVIKGLKYNFSRDELDRRSRQGKSNGNLRRVTDGINNKSIHKEQLEQFLKDNPGWRQGQTQKWTQESIDKNISGEGHKKYKERKSKEREEKRNEILRIREENKKRGQIWINDGVHNLRIYKDELQKYSGWNVGFLHTLTDKGRENIIDAGHASKGKINITINGKWTKIKKELLDEFIKEHPDTQIGWVGLVTGNKNGSSGYKWMKKNGEYKYVSPSEIEQYEKNGWTYGYKNTKVKSNI